ncbi:MAG: helix-turn-helix domain-containing protein [Paenibacillaceae bacterium]|nr:helix-turn-helix domain-containing protein [Paenibacillaceae bacterium]
MKRIRGQLKWRKTYAQIWTYLVIAGVGVLVISTVFLYTLSSRTILRNIGMHTESQLSQRAESLSFAMNWIVEYAQRSSQNPAVRAYALQPQSTPFEDYNFWNLLVGMKDTNPYIDSIYVINGYSGKVIDTRLGVSDTEAFYDRETLRLLKQGRAENVPFMTPRLVPTSVSFSPQERLLTIVIPFEIEKSATAFVANISSDALLQLNPRPPAPSGSDTFVLDRDNRIVAGTRATDFLKPFSELDYSFSLAGKQGWFEYSSAADKLLVAHSDVVLKGFTPWKIIDLLPERRVLGDIRYLQTFTLLFFVCLLAVTLWMIRKLSQKIYTPIQELIMDVTAGLETPPDAGAVGTNELRMLSSVFSEQHRQIGDYSRNRKYLAKEAYLRSLLESASAPDVEQVQRNFREHELHLATDNIGIALLRIDHYAAFTLRYPERDRRLLRFAMGNIAKEHLQPLLHVEAVDMGGDHIALLFNPEQDTVPDSIKEAVAQCQQLIRQYLAIDTTAVVGPVVENYRELHDGCKEAYELSNERFQSGWGRTIAAAETNRPAYTKVPYPKGKERLLIQGLKKGDAYQTLEELESFRRQLEGNTHSEAKLAIAMLLLGIGEALHSLPLPSFRTAQWSLSPIQSRIEQLETSEAVFGWLRELLSLLCTDVASLHKPSRGRSLIDEMRQLVEEQLCDQNLSTKTIADQLGLSVNYVRNLFKTETGQSLMDGINDRRLARVVELMGATSLSIDDIVLRCGFASTVSFYPIFKKKYGVTPAKFRKDMATG